ncbi:MAG: DUF2807 domain-containing protein [Prolixibacteraceae bacterium]|jgi:hypothetical protein|nr:DUF2807 domain-containing protein [Prolixibacteraceae bacterium]
MQLKVFANYILAFLTILFLGLVQTEKAACQDAEWVTQTWETGNFDEAVLEGAFKIFLVQGNTNSVMARAADSGIFEYLNIRNERGILNIKVTRKPFDLSRIEIYITFKTLRKIEADGGTTIETDGYLNLDDMFIRLKGGSKMKFFAKVRDLRLVNEGGVLIELSGVAEKLDVRLAGAGNINAAELRADDVIFTIEGVGTGIVHAIRTLNAEIKGAGKLRYRGNPRVTKTIEGLGSVQGE